MNEKHKVSEGPPWDETARVALFSIDKDLIDRVAVFCDALGYRPAAFVDIKDFHAFVSRKHVAVVLIDLGVSRHEGMAAAWELRNKSVHAPLLALVDDGSAPGEEELYGSGFDGILDKNSTDEHFHEVVDNFMHQGRLRQKVTGGSKVESQKSKVDKE